MQHSHAHAAICGLVVLHFTVIKGIPGLLCSCWPAAIQQQATTQQEAMPACMVYAAGEAKFECAHTHYFPIHPSIQAECSISRGFPP